MASSGTYGGLEATTDTVASSSGNASARSTSARRRFPAPMRRTFSFAHTNASTDFSAAYTRACGTSVDRKSTPELQSLMRTSYAVFCLKKKKQNQKNTKAHIL